MKGFSQIDAACCLQWCSLDEVFLNTMPINHQNTASNRCFESEIVCDGRTMVFVNMKTVIIDEDQSQEYTIQWAK